MMSEHRTSKEETPPFTVERYGSFGAAIMAENRWLRAALASLKDLTCGECVPCERINAEIDKALSGEPASAHETSGEPEPVAFVGYLNEQPDIIYPGTTRLEGRRYLPIWRPEDHPCARRDAQKAPETSGKPEFISTKRMLAEIIADLEAVATNSPMSAGTRTKLRGLIAESAQLLSAAADRASEKATGEPWKVGDTWHCRCGAANTAERCSNCKRARANEWSDMKAKGDL